MTDAPSSDAEQAVDSEHLKLLVVFHYVVGGLTLFFSCFAILYIVFGVAMVVAPDDLFPPGRPDHPNQRPPAFFGYAVAAIGTMGLVAGWTFAGMTIYSARSIQQRKRRLLSLIVAGFNCAWFPFGTALGVCTLIVLCRDSVRKLYTS
jgi:hypothetical protein